MMNLRDPGKKLPHIKPDSLKPGATVNWKQYKVTLLTPMFGGGTVAGEPDTAMPVRATAIRGQLRYWWRFLAKTRKKDELPGKALFEEERRIWGGMAENDEADDDKDPSSKVKIRISDVTFNERENIAACAEYVKYDSDHPTKAGQYKTLPRYDSRTSPYALFPCRGKLKNSWNIEEQPALLFFSLGFTMEIAIDSNSKLMAREVLSALRWWATFGGLGARTRRGCGSIFCHSLSPVTEQEAEEMNCTLIFSARNVYDDAIGAWKVAVQHLRDFRQKPGVGRKRGHDHPGPSKWPEPDSIREIIGTHSQSAKGKYCHTHTPDHPARISFPRAAFGLPIIFKFKDEGCGDPKQTELKPENCDRLASPLILIPYPVNDLKGNTTRFRPAALLLPHNHLKNIKLQLSDTPAYSQEKKTEWEEKGWDDWIDQWQPADKAADIFPIKKCGGQNALDAFMTFFQNGGQLHD